MESQLRSVYDEFDKQRREYDALMADEQDLLMLEEAEKMVKNR